jgi:TolB-like protein
MDNESPTPSPQTSGLSAFWQELKRRKVMRVAITYAVVAWIVIQIAVATFPTLLIPDWALRLVTMSVLLGFPVAIILAWAFELSPDGIKTTKAARIDNPDGESDSAVQKKRNWFSVLFAAAIPTLIFGALAVFFYFRSDPNPTPLASSPAPPGLSSSNGLQVEDLDKSIAVLPFANRSANEEDVFFTDGIHDDLLTHISRIHDIKTISRTSVMGYRDTTKSMPTIGQELGVAHILEGGVQRAGNQIRINVQLIDADKDEHIWAEIYTREMTAENIFEIQTEIAITITEALQAALSPEEQEDLAKLPTTTLAALEAYFKGKQAEYPPTVHGLANAIQFYDEALELDPEFADAHAHKAMALFQQLQTGTVLSETNRPLVETHLEKTLELNPKLSVAHHARAEMSWSLSRRVSDVDEVAESFQRAIDLDPANTQAAIR